MEIREGESIWDPTLDHEYITLIPRDWKPPHDIPTLMYRQEVMLERLVEETDDADLCEIERSFFSWNFDLGLMRRSLRDEETRMHVMRTEWPMQMKMQEWLDGAMSVIGSTTTLHEDSREILEDLHLAVFLERFLPLTFFS